MDLHVGRRIPRATKKTYLIYPAGGIVYRRVYYAEIGPSDFRWNNLGNGLGQEAPDSEIGPRNIWMQI